MLRFLKKLSLVTSRYAIKVLQNGDVQTIGKVDYDNGQQHCYSFTSHPKVDPVTGEMFTFCMSNGSPYLMYRVISQDGVMRVSVPITLSASTTIMHDFAITENYALFIDHPYCCNVLLCRLLTGKSNSSDPNKKTRFGIQPRYAQDEKLIKWFELPACLVFHVANAWEEGNEVVLICCRNPLQEFSISELYEMRFNMITGLACQKRLSASYIDCPKINKSYTCRKQRYVYGMKRRDSLPRILDHSGKMFSAVIKFDLEAEPETEKTKLRGGGNVKGTFEMGPEIYGSDVVFVARAKLGNIEEDDGYLLFFAHDDNTGKSAVMVIDAKTMSPDPVATIELPTRVPYGSHALFLTEDQLREHQSTEHVKCS